MHTMPCGRHVLHCVATHASHRDLPSMREPSAPVARSIGVLILAGKEVSTWHGVPLHLEGGALSFICEIPKETSAKMEVATVGPGTPLYWAPCCTTHMLAQPVL